MIDESRASSGVLLRRHLRDLEGANHMSEVVIDEIVAGVERIKGPTAAQTLRELGLGVIHEVIDAREVGPLRDFVLDRLRLQVLAMAVLIGRKVLGWTGDFYVDDYLILRVNFPYRVARLADQATENPGAGRLSPSVRATNRARSKKDPIYDPKSYHNGHPPAAWAHGPHRDSWVGHSRDGRNIWWAITDVPSGAGMVLYPELADEILPFDPRTLYVRAGYQLPKPTYLPVQAGEMLVFDPEVLHGTHLNTTDRTRVAVSLRLNAMKPKFDPTCFYAREFWRKASDIEAGRDEVRHLRREENFAEPYHLRPTAARSSMQVITGSVDTDSGTIRAVMSDATTMWQRLIVDAGTHRIMIVRTSDGLKAYSAACPHYGVDLADGGSDERTMYCPACAIGFDMQTGHSECNTFVLASYTVWESGGAIMLIKVSA